MYSKDPEYLFSITENIRDLIITNYRKSLDSSPNELVEELLAEDIIELNKRCEEIKNSAIASPQTVKDQMYKLLDTLDSAIEQNQNPEMRSQLWYMARMKALGYDIDKGGMCYGVSHMAMQAFLANDIQTFNKRLQIIYNTPVDDFKNDFSGLRKKQQQLIAEGRTDEAAIINTNIVNMLAFFDGIALYHAPQKYKDLLLPKGYILPQDSEKTMPVTLPLTLDTEDKKPVVVGTIANNTFNKDEFKNQLIQLQEKSGEHSFSLMLDIKASSSDWRGQEQKVTERHVINLNYDSETKRWILIDPNLLPGEEYSDVDKLAASLFSASLFSGLGIENSNELDISTTIYTTSDHAKKMKADFLAMSNKTSDEIFFETCCEHAKDAIKKGDLLLVEQEIARVVSHFGKGHSKEYNIRFYTEDIAFQFGQIEILKYLIKNDPIYGGAYTNPLIHHIMNTPPEFHAAIVSSLGTELGVMFGSSPNNYEVRFALQRLSKDAHPAFITACGSDITRLTSTFNDARAIYGLLSPAGRTALMASQGERLCSLLLDEKTMSANSVLHESIRQELESWRSKQALSNIPTSSSPANANPLVKETQLRMKQAVDELKVGEVVNESKKTPKIGFPR